MSNAATASDELLLPSMQSGNDVPAVHSLRRRRRGRKACDDCRRLKIKCNGLAPCTHCAAYERACTYNVPYRRPKGLAEHARDLEDRLRTVEKLLNAANRGLDLDDTRVEPTHDIPRILQMSESAIRRDQIPAVNGCQVPTGQPSGSTLPPAGRKQHKPQQKPTLNPVIPLPSKDATHDLLAHALQDACVLHSFVHEPLFYSMVDYIYRTPAEKLMKDHRNALALFYAALALGTFFADGSRKNSTTPAADMKDGAFYFNWAVNFLDLNECQCLVSLQALCFLVIFLQSTGQLDRCYSYVGVALRSAVALRLHCCSTNVVDPVEREIGKRVFWVVWRMDVYSSSMLGIPPMLDTGFVDQSFPEPFHDIQGNTASFASEHDRLLVASANAHTRLTLIMPKVMRLVKTVKRNTGSSPIDLEHLIGKTRMVEIEQELQRWYQRLVSEVLPGGERTPQLERSVLLLCPAMLWVPV
ncbi:Gypsy retrotransposon integrase-like protein 1 [Aspergillus niger]